MALPAALSTELAKTVTTPLYLIQIGFTPVVRYSTRGDVSYNGQSWLDIGASVDRITADSVRGRVATITLSNHDDAVSALILAQGIREKTCQIWQAYSATSPIPTDQIIQVFNGYLVEVPQVNTIVTLVANALPESVTLTPRFRITPPTANHLPPPGTKIAWNGETFVLERDRT